MCVTPAGKRSVIVPVACPNCCHIRAKKAAFFTLFYQSKTVSSQFLFLPICRQEGIWSFDPTGRFFRGTLSQALRARLRSVLSLRDALADISQQHLVFCCVNDYT